MAEYHYLESLDSVASPWEASDQGSGGLVEARHLQIFCEILMTLMLGRTVVVPQSYAFDSWGFLDIASAILSARESRRPHDRPFRLHLFNANTFDEAIAAMLGRVGSPGNPFVSSLLPELRDPAASGLPVPATAEALMQSSWLGDRRAEALRIIRDEFRSLPRVSARPKPDAPTLPQALAAFVTGPFTCPAGANPALAREVHDKLVTALHRLDITKPAPFLLRSRLRVSLPWPNDPQRRPAEEVVGGADTLGLVTEFVDAIYNAAVAASIGIAPVTFTTDLARTGDSLIARAIAQRLALAIVAPDHAPGPGNRVGPPGTATPDPLFKVSAAASHASSDERLALEMRKLLARAAGDGVRELLAQRAATGMDGRARSTFWVSLDKYRAAVVSGNKAAAERAMDRHLKIAARILGRGFETSLAAGPMAQVLLSAAGGGSGTVATATWQLPVLASGAVIGISAAVSLGVPLAIAGFHGWHRRRQIFYALGTIQEHVR